METNVRLQIEKAFLSLPPEEQETIIRRGVALRLSDLKKRLFLAESKVRYFEEKYQTTLAQLDAEGIPDDAGPEMHEDYIMWHHWDAVARKTRQDIESIQPIAQHGLQWTEPANVGD